MVWLWMVLAFGQAVDTGIDPSDDPYGACPSCYDDGLCTVRRGVCVADGDDCIDTNACQREGLCTAKEGVCVRAPGDCRKTDACRRDGACEDQGDACVVGSASDCRASEDCGRNGRCDLVGGTCEANSAADCAASELCGEMGLCGLLEGSCDATEDAHCAASDDCGRNGDCVLVDGRCGNTPATCAASEVCKKDGKCTSKGWGCVVGGPADCKKSESCNIDGACGFDDGRCVPRTDAACAASEKCRDEGACWFLQSNYAEPDPKVEAGQIAENAGVLAQLMGASGDGHGDMCGPRGDEDCKKSTRCDGDGWCTMREGEGGFSGPSGPTCTPEGYNSFFGSAGLGSGLDSAFGSEGIGTEFNGGIGGLIGAKGTQIGDGGFGGLGSGGGTVGGLGGMGTVGRGSGGYVEAAPETRVDPVRVKGDRKPRAVRKGLRAVRVAVKRCTEDEVAVAFEVSAKGKLSAVEVRSGAEGKVADCVAKAVGKASLDKGPAVSVTWTVRQGAAKE